jgi:neutral trehalase
MPLFAGACTQLQAEKLKAILVHSFKADSYLMCSSSAVDEQAFNPVKYWRGPIWINVNWMLYNGLKRYGFDQLAQQVKSDSLQLVERTGFYEYFDPRADKADQDRGLGGNYFSWTAALYLDFITHQ